MWTDSEHPDSRADFPIPQGLPVPGGFSREAGLRLTFRWADGRRHRVWRTRASGQLTWESLRLATADRRGYAYSTETRRLSPRKPNLAKRIHHRPRPSITDSATATSSAPAVPIRSEEERRAGQKETFRTCRRMFGPFELPFDKAFFGSSIRFPASYATGTRKDSSSGTLPIRFASSKESEAREGGRSHVDRSSAFRSEPLRKENVAMNVSAFQTSPNPPPPPPPPPTNLQLQDDCAHQRGAARPAREGTQARPKGGGGLIGSAMGRPIRGTFQLWLDGPAGCCTQLVTKVCGNCSGFFRSEHGTRPSKEDFLGERAGRAHRSSPAPRATKASYTYGVWGGRNRSRGFRGPPPYYNDGYCVSTAQK